MHRRPAGAVQRQREADDGGDPSFAAAPDRTCAPAAAVAAFYHAAKALAVRRGCNLPPHPRRPMEAVQ